MTNPRLALTSTRDRCIDFVDDVNSLGLEPVVLPCIEFVPAGPRLLERARLEAGRADWMVLTSPRVIEILWPEAGMPSTMVAAVGSVTARAVRDAGGTVALVGEGGAVDLVERIADRLGGRTVAYPHADGADPSTEAALVQAGAVLHGHAVYEVKPIAPGPAAVDAVAFGSPSAVTGWSLSRHLDGLTVGVIGDTTGRAVEARGDRYHVIPPAPSFQVLIRLVAEQLKDRSPA